MEKKESLLQARYPMVHHPACPDPSKARAYCECGANGGCASCGWGKGAHPCRCQRERMKKVGNA
jgi:hypothetical protein